VIDVFSAMLWLVWKAEFVLYVSVTGFILQRPPLST
jgi:hypothetical protein